MQSRTAKQAELQLGDIAAHRIADMSPGRTILDVGGGGGRHSLLFADHGHEVTYNDIYDPGLNREEITCLIGDFNSIQFRKHDIVFASHVLEHQPSPHLFLKNLKRCTYDGGLIAVIVPPLKHQVVSGHYTLWNAGLVLYNLVMAGLSTKTASILKYGYNIAVIIKKQPIILPKLNYDYGDLSNLKQFFPDGLAWEEDSFNGDIGELNWM